MSQPNIAQQVRDYIVKIGKLREPPGDGDRLADKGFIPSVRLLDLVGFLEDNFRIKLRPVDLGPEKLTTIEQIVTLVQSRITASPRSPRASS